MMLLPCKSAGWKPGPDSTVSANYQSCEFNEEGRKIKEVLSLMAKVFHWNIQEGREEATAVNYRACSGVDLIMSKKKEGYFNELRAYKH